MADDLAPPDGPSRQELEAVLRQLAGPATADGPTRSAASHRPPANPAPPDPGRPAEPVAPDRFLTAETLRGLLEAIPDALVIIEPAGRIVLVNAQAEGLFGYRRDELIGRPVELLLPERLRERHVGQRGGYFAKPHTRPMGAEKQLVGRRKDGHEVPVEISLSPLPTDAGLLVVASVRDVTERRKADAQLRQMEARYRSLVEGIPAVTFMAALDEGGERELYVSPQIEALLGFSQREWLENPILWFTQLHEEDRGRWHEEFAKTVATGERFRSVYRFVSRDGRVVWVHGEAQVVKEGGRPLFLQGVAFDITGIKQAEEELKALNATLEQRVAQRTAELAHSNLALERFAERAAHDLQKPLGVMTSFMQILAERHREQFDATGDSAFLVSRTLVNSARMRTLTEDLLKYSRARTKKKELVPTGVMAALQVACEHLRGDLAETGAEVTADEDLPAVMADPTQLWELLQNLISNALKFRGEKPPEVHVGARRRGDRWEISVRDNGIGVEPQYLERIFGLGERLHTAEEYPGSGIGLATCQTIVEKHGGRIWASSEGKGQGTTITFTLAAAGE